MSQDQPTRSKVVTLTREPYRPPEGDEPFVDPEVVGMLEEYLEQARQGKFCGLSLVALRPDGGIHAGSTGCDDALLEPFVGGLDVLKFRILGNFFYHSEEI